MSPPRALVSWPGALPRVPCAVAGAGAASGICPHRFSSAVTEREMDIPVPGWGTRRCPPRGEKNLSKRKVLLRECGGGEVPVPRGSRRLLPARPVQPQPGPLGV